MSAAAAICMAAGVSGFVGFLLGALNNRGKRTVTRTDPFDNEGNLSSNVALAGAAQVMDYATDRGEDVQYLRAKAAIERYRTDNAWRHPADGES